MSKLTVVFGGQFGSEGKGQVAAYIHEQQPVDIAVRVGGPNAGHTFYHAGEKVVVQSVPCPTMVGAVGVIGAGGLIIPELLRKELIRAQALTGSPARLYIDRHAVIIDEHHMDLERGGITDSIGSTGEGVGAALAEKIRRSNPHLVVKNRMIVLGEEGSNVSWGADTSYILNKALKDEPQIHVLIEGTQGFGLSLHTSDFYPFCTSRECTPAGLYCDTGINPNLAGEVETVMVIRTYPIRVGGNSGDLPGEITWEDLKGRTNGYVKEPEITTVTRKPRRIAEIDLSLLKRAVTQCGPVTLAVTFLDYVFPSIASKSPEHWHGTVWTYLASLAYALGSPVGYVSNGPGCTWDVRSQMADYLGKLVESTKQGGPRK